MSAISNQPTNKNFLSPLGFKFLIKKTPNINWFVQSVNVPGIKVPAASIDTPFVRIPFSGEQMTFDDLRITFRVDEDMKNYLEIYDWLIGTAFPETFEQYEGTGPSTSNNNRFLKPKQLKSDASLIIMNSAMNPIIDVSFIDIAPTDLSEITFDTRLTDVNYVDATVVFSYLRYKINPI